MECWWEMGDRDGWAGTVEWRPHTGASCRNKGANFKPRGKKASKCSFIRNKQDRKEHKSGRLDLKDQRTGRLDLKVQKSGKLDLMKR